MSQTKPEIFTEIPDSLQKLTRLVTRGFYGFEHGVVIDLLIKNICMREDDIRDLVRLDPKQLRQILLQLKGEKIVKERQQVETRPDNNRPLRHNYYFISYMGLINMLKYKLDHMRKKLESEEKDTTTRASYKCPACQKSFTDLDVGFLWNGAEMVCTFCQTPVEEDTTAGPNTSTRSLLAKFNEQMLPFYELLRELDDIRLAPNLLEPALKRNGLTVAGGMDMSRESSSTSVPSLGGRSTDFAGMNYKQDVSIIIESQMGDGSAAPVSQGPAPKEVPVWMRTSTVGEVPLETYDNLPSNSLGIVLPKFTVGPTPTAKVTEDLQSLLAAEKTLKSPPHTHDAAKAKVEESEDDSDLEDVHMVEVEGKPIALADVTPELVTKMSTAEKAKYVEVSQQMYAMYD